MDLSDASSLMRDVALSLLKRESWRLTTFDDAWPHRHIATLSKETMASAGFFYTGYQDHVQCAFCLKIIGDWTATDIPIVEHRRHTIEAPNFHFCPFAAGLTMGNIPIDPFTGEDVTGTADQMNSLYHRMTTAGVPPGMQTIVYCCDHY